MPRQLSTIYPTLTQTQTHGAQKSLPEEGEKERKREEEREEKEPKVGVGNPNLDYMRIPEAEPDRGGALNRIYHFGFLPYLRLPEAVALMA